ncbi:MAG: apocytochrome f [Synechococcus sp. SAT82]|nr:apocytochrome f [Synechococcus sp. SAT82]|tara:strand:- start:1672 stop:2604 length:933 start_codon:yes stop_codon:yes gene_type:complete
MRRHLSLLFGSLILGLTLLVSPNASWAYPFWAQQNYESPREATGKIVCANCHLANKLTQAEVPQSVLPDSVFKASVKIPYEEGLQEIGADGSNVGMQVGAVIQLPDGFTLAPQDRWTDEIKEETEGVYFSQYSDEQSNILLVGPISGDQHQEIVFPVLAPDPATDNNIHFGKYQVHVGGNRGRGQVYPTGEKSNNTTYTAPASGSVASIEPGENGATVVTITTVDGENVTETIPVGPALQLSVGDAVEAGAVITNDPNVGGFGQVDAEIVLQDPVRIYGLLAFFAAVALAQIMLVLKKRQIEKVQAAEGV